MGRFNVAKAMQGGGGGIVNPAMDMGSMPTGTVAIYVHIIRINFIFLEKNSFYSLHKDNPNVLISQTYNINRTQNINNKPLINRAAIKSILIQY